MPKFKLEIETSNAAFEDNPHEIGDCLRRVRDQLRDNQGQMTGAISDSYGNTVGHWSFAGDSE